MSPQGPEKNTSLLMTNLENDRGKSWYLTETAA